MAANLFPGLSADTRLWVIALGESQGDSDDQGRLLQGLEEILGAWRHKGHAYEAAWEVLDGRLLLVVEPRMAAEPSGCAIDGMLRKVQRLAASLDRPVLGEERVLVRIGGRLRDLGRDELGDRLADGTLDGATPVFDRSLHHLGQLREGRLERPLAATWIGRRFGVAAEVHS